MSYFRLLLCALVLVLAGCQNMFYDTNESDSYDYSESYDGEDYQSIYNTDQDIEHSNNQDAEHTENQGFVPDSYNRNNRIEHRNSQDRTVYIRPQTTKKNNKSSKTEAEKSIETLPPSLKKK